MTFARCLAHAWVHLFEFHMRISSSAQKTVRILGTHGVPAGYGGFETAAENVALFLASRGWRVIVYCQVDGSGSLREDVWNGLERVLIPVDVAGWKGTSKFDLLSIRHASKFHDLCLTFGYNTAIFNAIQRLKKIPNVINMDGIEWSRARWGFLRQAILYTNERIACFVGNHLIADHPEIEKYLLTRAPARKLATITYGADPVADAPREPVLARGLEPGRYMTLICRPIPENSIAELVRGFSRRTRGYKLALLGEYLPDEDPYHRAVVESASEEVVFLGPIYDREEVKALRLHSAAYLHGHTVGGTNPSLVEAMAAGNPVLAHDNAYNRWVAQDGAMYFSTEDDVSDRLEEMLVSPQRMAQMRAASLRRHEQEFTWEHVAGQYEQLLLRYLPQVRVAASEPVPLESTS
jgi:glycosyltransferase involved in cell wall biosynthesis